MSLASLENEIADLQAAVALLVASSGSSGASLVTTGPGGIAGAFTGAAQTLTSPGVAPKYGTWWGVANQPLVTITAPPVVAGATFVLRVDQDSAGGRQLSFALTPAVNDPTGMLNVQAGIIKGAVTLPNAVNHIRMESDGIAWYAYPDTAGTPTFDQANQIRWTLGEDMIQSAMAAQTTNLAALTGLAAVDGYTPLVNDGILLTGQTTPAQNGFWYAQSGVWQRPSSYPTGGQFRVRMVWVAGGSTNSGLWVCANTVSKTIDTDSTTWVKKV